MLTDPLILLEREPEHGEEESLSLAGRAHVGPQRHREHVRAAAQHESKELHFFHREQVARRVVERALEVDQCLPQLVGQHRAVARHVGGFARRQVSLLQGQQRLRGAHRADGVGNVVPEREG